MTEIKKTLPLWILIVSGIIALLEIMVSVSFCVAPEEVLDSVDVNAKGVRDVIYMWAARQFAIGFIFGFATFKKSIPMLTLAWIFFLVIMIGDFGIGILNQQNGLIIASLIMIVVSSGLLFAINKRKTH